jgi:hypothetical protein
VAIATEVTVPMLDSVLDALSDVLAAALLDALSELVVELAVVELAAVELAAAELDAGGVDELADVLLLKRLVVDDVDDVVDVEVVVEEVEDFVDVEDVEDVEDRSVLEVVVTRALDVVVVLEGACWRRATSCALVGPATRKVTARAIRVKGRL